MASVYVGTSGFSYKEWKPSFYPADLSAQHFLQFYATRFGAVEIDSTFYRMPTEKMIDAWRTATPEGFRFAIKAPQRITHRERLKVPSESPAYFARTIAALGDRLGTALYQLPPYFRADVAKLAAFLDLLPRTQRASFEFRHDSWFQPDVYRVLRNAGAALVIHDADDRCTPIEVTSDFVYLRLRKSVYPEAERRQWQERFRVWRDSGVDVFAFIKHEDNPDAPRIASEFKL